MLVQWVRVAAVLAAMHCGARLVLALMLERAGSPAQLHRWRAKSARDGTSSCAPLASMRQRSDAPLDSGTHCGVAAALRERSTADLMHLDFRRAP